jgi:hypothetical protein
MEIDSVGFIKIDVEGAERSVFRGPERYYPVRDGRASSLNAQRYCAGLRPLRLDLLKEVESYGYKLEEIDHAIWCAIPQKTADETHPGGACVKPTNLPSDEVDGIVAP